MKVRPTHVVVLLPLLVLAAGAVAMGQRTVLTPIEQLGKELFFDEISRPARAMSCASCHGPSAGWTGPIAGNNLHGGTYRGAVPTRFGARRPPSSAYAAFAPVFHLDPGTGAFFGGNFWDGRATGERLGDPAAEQALGPFLNPVEQNMPNAQAVCEHVARARYAALFKRTWGPASLDCSVAGIGLTYDRIGLSIAEYERSPEVSAFSSRFDDYWRACLAAGNAPDACGTAEGEKVVLDPTHILTAKEFDGLIEFGEYCSACHDSTTGTALRPPLFTDFSFANIGVPRNPANPFYKMDRVYLDDGSPINPDGEHFVDFGLGGFLRSRPDFAPLAEENDGKHRTPTVRNVDKRPGLGFAKAYMHNGALKSLHEVVRFYNTRDVPSANWPAPEVTRNVNRDLLVGVPLGDLGLDDDAVDAIVAFLKTLNDRDPARK
jgi:cytochrome c peroxidase